MLKVIMLMGTMTMSVFAMDADKENELQAPVKSYLFHDTLSRIYAGVTEFLEDFPPERPNPNVLDVKINNVGRIIIGAASSVGCLGSAWLVHDSIHGIEMTHPYCSTWECEARRLEFGCGVIFGYLSAVFLCSAITGYADDPIVKKIIRGY